MKLQLTLFLLAVSKIGLSNADDAELLQTIDGKDLVEEEPDEVKLPQADEDLLKACEAEEPNFEDVKDALTKGADLNVKHPQSGQTCLMVASLLGNTDIVRYLLKNTDVDKYIEENNGYVPTDGAAYQGRADVMTLLIEAGMKPDYFHEDGFTPLHRACWGGEPGHVDTIRVLLEHGVDMDVETTSEGREGETCMEMTEYEPIKELLEEWREKKGNDTNEL